MTYYRSVFTYAKAGAAAEQLLQVLQPEGLVRREGGAWSWKYFKTDHVGSTRVLLAACGSGLVAEQTSDFYPFGTAHGAFEDLHLNRYLYGGKEYQDAAIVLGLYDFHARYYNPMYGRWFNQDPRLQTTNPYLYNANSPAMYVDPDGEFFFSAILPGIGALIDAVLWGATISVGTNGISNVINDQPFFQGAGWAALTGAIGGFQSFGIGTLAQGMSKFGGIAFQTAMHGHLGGMMNMMNGGKYGAGFASGAFGSLAATGSGLALQNAGKFGQATGMIGAGALSGGISSVIAGGNFMDGLRNGAISSGLNHAMHMMEGPNSQGRKRDETIQKYNEIVKGANNVLSISDIVKYFSAEEIAWLVKAGRITRGLGVTTTLADSYLAISAFTNDQPWKDHAINAGIGAMSLIGMKSNIVGFSLGYYYDGVKTIHKEVITPINTHGVKWMMNKLLAPYWWGMPSY